MNDVRQMVRDLWQRMWSPQSLVFLFFLVLSTAFWFLLTLNEVTEHDVEVKVDWSEVPRGKVLTSDVPATLQVTLRDRGFALLNVMYGDQRPTVRVPAGAFEGREGHVRLMVADLVKSLRAQLPATTTITAHKPDTLDFFYNSGRSRRVAVRLASPIVPAAGFSVVSTRFVPDSVTIWAASAVLDTLRYVTLPAADLHGASTPADTLLPVNAIKGTRIQPARVRIQTRTERLVEKKVRVDVVGEHFPAGVRLRTFPAQVEVSCQVAMSDYRRTNAQQFRVTVDYHHLGDISGNRCRVTLQRAPANARFARLSTNEVEYVLELSEQ